MKRKLLYIILGLLLPVAVSAYPVKATISSGNHQKIRVSIDGYLINKRPFYEVSLHHVKPGRHHARIEVFGKHGKRVIHDQIYLKKGFQTHFTVRSRYGSVGIYRTHLSPLRYTPTQPVDYYPGPVTHRPLISEADYYSLSERISKARFDSERMNAIKHAIRYRSVYAEDIANLMGFFVYESSRLSLAKYAYRRTIDRENFYLVYEGFRFASTRREFERFLYPYPI